MLAALVACPPASASPETDEALRLQIETAFSSGRERVLGERLRETEKLARFYAERGHEPAWRGGAIGRDARALRASIGEAARHGLHPESYHAHLLRWLEGTPVSDAQRLAEIDLLLSDAFLHLARHLSSGAVDPGSLHPGYERAGAPAPDSSEALAAALEAGEIAETLARMAPAHAEYSALVRELQRLREVARAGDSKAGARADRVRANLERWRWLPRDLGRRHLRVNTPAFTLQAFEAGEPVLTMRVVVGDQEWQTPLAHATISHLVLNPSWRVPWSIATREMLPAARRDPGYFDTAGIQVLVEDEGVTHEVDARQVDWAAITAESFHFRLRQPPGPANPLGRIKFMFPNPFGVYLHGTPSDAAFERPIRTLSHGCVRVEDEIALAAFALAPDPDWTRERVAQALRSAWEDSVRLPIPLPVHLLYFTASADAEARVSFTDDAYGWDPALLEALDTR